MVSKVSKLCFSSWLCVILGRLIISSFAEVSRLLMAAAKLILISCPDSFFLLNE